MIYVWRYVGLRPDIRLIAVSENETVQKNILNDIQYSKEYDFDSNLFNEKWDEMDRLHYEKWQREKSEYVMTVKNECNYRLEQAAHSFHQREAILRDQIKKAEDDKIKRMRISQLDKLTADFEKQKSRMEETIQHADIHTNLQVKGILHVN